MPLTNTRTFRIRNYECDAHGHLNNANYLRFMQVTATDASAAAGYSRKEYEEMARHWLIRGTQIEYLLPAFYDNTLRIITWVSDFRRASSRREYEFIRVEDGKCIARAFTDWVFLNTNTGRPATIPAELINAFYPEGVPDSFPPRERFPEAPPPPTGVYKIHRHVDWGDIDQMGHVNNSVYMDYVTECGMQVLAAYDWPWERMIANGFAIFLRRNQIQYLQPAIQDDELEIATWVSNIRRSTATRHYEITRLRDNTTIARINAFSVWVDISTGKPIRIPPNFLADFKPNIV